MLNRFLQAKTGDPPPPPPLAKHIPFPPAPRAARSSLRPLPVVKPRCCARRVSHIERVICARQMTPEVQSRSGRIWQRSVMTWSRRIGGASRSSERSGRRSWKSRTRASASTGQSVCSEGAPGDDQYSALRVCCCNQTDGNIIPSSWASVSHVARMLGLDVVGGALLPMLDQQRGRC